MILAHGPYIWSETPILTRWLSSVLYHMISIWYNLHDINRLKWRFRKYPDQKWLHLQRMLFLFFLPFSGCMCLDKAFSIKAKDINQPKIHKISSINIEFLIRIRCMATADFNDITWQNLCLLFSRKVLFCLYDLFYINYFYKADLIIWKTGVVTASQLNR